MYSHSWGSLLECRGVFRTQWSIWDKAFLKKLLTASFCKKAPSQVCDWFLNTPLESFFDTVYVLLEFFHQKECTTSQKMVNHHHVPSNDHRVEEILSSFWHTLQIASPANIHLNDTHRVILQEQIHARICKTESWLLLIQPIKHS